MRFRMWGHLACVCVVCQTGSMDGNCSLVFNHIRDTFQVSSGFSVKFAEVLWCHVFILN